jgi:hypothetical protein
MEPQSTPNMQIDAGRDRINRFSKRTIGGPLTVRHALGRGSLKVHESALLHQRREAKFADAEQHRLASRDDGIVVERPQACVSACRSTSPSLAGEPDDSASAPPSCSRSLSSRAIHVWTAPFAQAPKFELRERTDRAAFMCPASRCGTLGRGPCCGKRIGGSHQTSALEAP